MIQAVIVINLVLVTFAYLTLAERKIMGRMQLRYGPNRAGPYGLLQPIADLVKLIRKESFFPAAAIDVLYIFSPFLAAFTALCTFSVIPYGPGFEIGPRWVGGAICPAGAWTGTTYRCRRSIAHGAPPTIMFRRATSAAHARSATASACGVVVGRERHPSAACTS